MHDIPELPFSNRQNYFEKEAQIIMMISNNAFLSRNEMNLVHIHVYSLYFL